MNRVRLRYTKLGKIRFTGHRDVARLWERALRRASLPVAYSEGFAPHPRLHFGLALSTGYESMAEYLEVDLEPDAVVVVDELPERLSAVLPAGLEVVLAAPVPAGEPSLQESVTSCSWEIEVTGQPATVLRDAVSDALARPALPFVSERKGRPVEFDLRPLVLELAVAGEREATTRLAAELGTQPRAVRPAELVAALGPGIEVSRVCRMQQWTSLDGARREPLPVGATRAEHAEARAT